MNPNPEPLIITNLRYAYPDSSWQLDAPEFRGRAGEIVAVIGPNGSGKSTLLRLAAGVLPFTQGRIEILGEDIRSLDRRRAAKVLGYLPQETTAEFDFRVIDVVAMGRYAHLPAGGFLRDHDQRVVDECMKQTGTMPLKHRRLSRLSGGERKRVLLASVLAQEPRMLLLDEPTGALDLHHQVRFFAILTQLAEAGLSVIVVTHDMNLASLYCHRMVLMCEGRIVRDGPPEEVLTREQLAPIYGGNFLIGRHPQIPRPLIYPDMKGTGG
ncbi:MAG: ABC transporter ATP-binding protein [bacterium]